MLPKTAGGQVSTLNNISNEPIHAAFFLSFLQPATRSHLTLVTRVSLNMTQLSTLLAVMMAATTWTQFINTM